MNNFRIILFVLVLAGCQNVERPEKPENLISKDKMVQILAESYTGNAARSVRNRTLRDAGVALDSILYSQFDIDSVSFAESNTYYASQINDYIDIISQVETILDGRKKKLDSILEIEGQKKRDSIDKKRDRRKLKSDSVVPDQGLIDPVKE